MSSDFQHENKIITKAMSIIESQENYNNVDFHKEYCELTKNYKKLFRQLVKLTTISDKLQRKLISAQDDLKELIITDSLTKLNNRRKLDETLADKASNFKLDSLPLSIIMIDIDKFKEVNDLYGHHVGDSVLIQFSDLLKKQVKLNDILGRWGGEEFMIISPNSNCESIKKHAEELRRSIANLSFQTVGNITASFGIAQYKYGEAVEDVIIRADEALYKAKENGRNRVEVNC